MTITTERLFLEPLSESDDNFIMELLNTEGWIKYIGNRNINSKEDAIAYIQRINDNANITYWTTKLKDTKIAIGLVTLIKRDYLEHNDIGFAFLPNYSNKGYAVEATKAVLSYLVEEKSISHIFAVILPENTGSIKLIEKLGLRFEKVVEIENEVLSVYKATVEQMVF